MVDPIDGTSPFLNGMPNWCVSVAVLHDGVPVIGVIFAPTYQECYVAALGRRNAEWPPFTGGSVTYAAKSRYRLWRE